MPRRVAFAEVLALVSESHEGLKGKLETWMSH